jgi:thiamine kinase-like enzyme
LAIPSAIDEVTPGWLTDALGRTVSSAHAERIAEDSGFSSLLYRVRLSGDADLPATVIVKLPGTPEARGAMEMLGGYRRELEFYRRVAGLAPMGTPQVHAAQIEDGNADFVLVMEDLQAWDNADHLAGLSLAQAQQCIAGLAGLHGWSADHAEATTMAAFPSLDAPMVRDLFFPVFGLAWPTYLEHTTQPVAPAVARLAENFTDYAAQALDVLSRRQMLLHGDIRADNLFFSGGEMKVVDFQFACRGAGASDIAYLVSQGLPTEVRSGRDEALLREYLDRLEVSDYTFDEAWRDYRMATAYLVVLPVITMMGWDGLPERSRQLIVTLTDRAVATIDEIGALEAFS